MEQLDQNLKSHGVNLGQGKLQLLFNSLQINPGSSKTLNRLDRYAKGHILHMNPEADIKVQEILNKICLEINANVSEDDL